MLPNYRQFLLAFSLITISACSSDTEYHSQNEEINVVKEIGAVPERLELPQGWDAKRRADFWFTSQGGQIIPYSWFTWLEQAGSTEYFRSAEHMELLRYLPMASSEANPSGLPIGFVPSYDSKTKQVWLGLTCAACHTNQIDYQDKKILVEGAPTLANFVLFFSNLVDALNETNLDDAKFDRFARNVLANKYSEPSAKKLRQALSRVALATAERQQVNALPANYDPDFTSYARLDAFGNIQNAGTAFALHDLANKNAPVGPVSYPFLWGTHQSNVVQWNASAPNTPVVGPLARNVGEVVGVFGDLSIDKAPWWKRLLGIKVDYSANIDLIGLGNLESWVKTLRSPQWPTQYFPAIDSVKAAKGGEIYASECASCHQVIPRQDEGKNYIAVKTPVSDVGTDPVTAYNASRNTAKTLILEGVKEGVLIGSPFKAESFAIDIPVNGAVGVILKTPLKSLEAGLIPLRTKSDNSKQALKQDVAEVKDIEGYVKQYLDEKQKIQTTKLAAVKANSDDKYAGLVYKARPLNGIWATAPYLHNGSVPNLWQLMQKPEERVTEFWVGSRNFDPINVGFNTAKGLNMFKVRDSQNQIIKGSSNQGHSYGTDLSDDDKWAVVEYMKTL